MSNIEKGKKFISYKKLVDSGRLMEELYDAIPEIKPEFTQGVLKVHLRVFTNGDLLTLWVDEGIEVDLINDVVNSHSLSIGGEE